jgi:hypothetical protein
VYDYTKSLRAALAWARGATLVHRTFSLSEANWDEARQALAAGVNVAVVVESEQVAEQLAAHLVVSGFYSGDEHDLRFLDIDLRGTGEAGCLCYLLPKGRARRDISGFVVRSGHLADRTKAA